MRESVNFSKISVMVIPVIERGYAVAEFAQQLRGRPHSHMLEKRRFENWLRRRCRDPQAKGELAWCSRSGTF